MRTSPPFYILTFIIAVIIAVFLVLLVPKLSSAAISSVTVTAIVQEEIRYFKKDSKLFISTNSPAGFIFLESGGIFKFKGPIEKEFKVPDPPFFIISNF